jgi:hypothetical protein
MNDKTTMRSEQNGNITNREFSSPSEGAPPESVMPSLVALNTWLLTWEERTEGGEQSA